MKNNKTNLRNIIKTVSTAFLASGAVMPFPKGCKLDSILKREEKVYINLSGTDLAFAMLRQEINNIFNKYGAKSLGKIIGAEYGHNLKKGTVIGKVAQVMDYEQPELPMYLKDSAASA